MRSWCFKDASHVPQHKYIFNDLILEFQKKTLKKVKWKNNMNSKVIAFSW